MYARAALRSREPSSRSSVGSLPTLWSVWIARVPCTSPAYCCLAKAVRWSIVAARLGFLAGGLAAAAVGMVVAAVVVGAVALLGCDAVEDASATPQPAIATAVT